MTVVAVVMIMVMNGALSVVQSVFAAFDHDTLEISSQQWVAQI